MSSQAPSIPSSPSPPAGAVTPSTAPPSSFLRHARVVGLITLVSRFAGLARDVVAAHFIGTGLVGSAFTIAFTIPNLFRKLFGEGALSAVFIPLYAQSSKNDLAEANNFAAAGINLLVAILIAITLVGEAVLAACLWWTEPQRLDLVLTLKLTMIMLPYVVLICGGAFLSGILQVHKRFAAPAAAPILLNLVHIAVVAIGATILGIRFARSAEEVVAIQTTLSYWLAAFVLVAGVLQVAVLVPGLRAVGFRFKLVPHFWTPQVKRMMRLTLPVALGAGVLQLSVLLDKGISALLMQGITAAGEAITHFSLLGHTFAYPLELGAPARLYYAQIMYQFPLGIFAIALATAIFPALSADAMDADRTRFKSILRDGLRTSLWEGLPASAGLVIVAEPAVRFLFQHGHVSEADATWIARSVALYASAVWAFGLQQILNRAYYALHDTTTPLLLSLVTLAVNLAVELPLLWTPLRESGMAAGTAVSFAVQSLVMLWLLNRKVGGLGLGELLWPVAKMLLATAAMIGACLAVRAAPFYPTADQRWAWALQLGLLVGTGAAVYLIASLALGLSTLRSILPKR